MTEATTDTATPETTPASAWLAVAFLVLVGILNFVDRFLPSVLAEPLKHDLVLTDTMLGFVNGIGFLLIYAILAIPIARLSDAGRYSLVISLSLGVWSALTIVSGLAQSGWQLATTRIGVAVGEAGVLPASHVFISRNFPVHRRAFVLSLFLLSVPIGMGLGYVIGGVLGGALGWRHTFMLMGAIGLVLAPLAHVILTRAQRQGPDAAPRVATTDKAPSILPLLAKPALLTLLTASMVASFAGLAVTAFIPAFLIRAHGMTVAEAGIQFGLMSGAGGIVALLVIGHVSDTLAKRHPRWLTLVLCAMYVATVPLSIVALTTPDRMVALTCLVANYALCLAFLAPCIAALHRIVPFEMRGRASAILSLVNSVGGGMGPFVAGALSEHFAPTLGVHALGHALLLVVPVTFGLGALFFFITALIFPAD